MAIGVDTTSAPVDPVSNATQISWTHTCTSATVLVVSIAVADSSDTDREVDTVTHNGKALTRAKRQDGSAIAGNAELWYRVSPDSGGTPDIVVTMNGTCTDLMAGAISLTGTKTDSSVIDKTGGATGNGNPSVSLITQTDGTYLVDAMFDDQREGDKVSGDYSEIYKEDVGNDTLGGQYRAGGSAGSHTMSWTDTDGDEDFVIAAVAIRDAAAAGPSGNPWWYRVRNQRRRAC